MAGRIAACGAAAGAMLVMALATAPVAGQTRSGSSYAPPRTADGHPDLQGVWRVWSLAPYDLEPHGASWGVPAGTGVVVDPPGGLIPYKPWALARKKENFARSRTTFPYDPLRNPDPLAKCYIPGVPRITYLGWPFEIVQSKEFVAFVYEWMHIRRMVPLTGRPVPQGIPFWGGLSRGRFEGNTLVVRVTNLSDWTWLDMAGNFYSQAAQVEERYTAVGPDTLDYEVTLTDPNVFERPWTIRVPIARQRDARLLEYECHALLDEAGVPLTWERDWDTPIQVPKE
ncbi:MAG: hypothetical protein A3I61_08265 [Acidobacteria bacterium RIFCSPLOWO2_02_FULL_68_18]|nr:MAG: hypothetical protein A3I61_08265 [Acidobacteria bacterium RIFCSPLOWO2_02_FULL_68_18]OFW51234.1 MAG: hypothetical protein A3G77_06360 [Acidobacteria bacterium RIFCSPLOWO2_12_FULL_68_19]